MELIRDIYAKRSPGDRPVISLEFFPTKTEQGEATLFSKTLPQLMELKPDFCSVTYGAGGSTRDKTLDIVDRIQSQQSLTAMAHLTCVNATRESILQYLAEARARGIKNILALRGDPPAGEKTFTKTEDGFEYSYQLVQLIREMGGFSIGAAGFPEGHIACEEGREVDWRHAKYKIDCGAEFLITQVFFDNADYFAFRDYMTQDLGVTVPLIPGILPILNAPQIKRFSDLCGARIPASLLETLEGLGDDPEAGTQFGIDFATRQIAGLIEAGVPGIHLYTLNKAHSTTAILKNLALV